VALDRFLILASILAFNKQITYRMKYFKKAAMGTLQAVRGGSNAH